MQAASPSPRRSSPSPPVGTAGGASSFQPAAAGALLATVTAIGIGAGGLVGWAAGSVGLGVLGGAIAGIPAAIFAVYLRYRGFFT